MISAIKSFRFKIIDLTQEVYTGMPVFPAHIKTIVFDYETHDDTKLLGFKNTFQAEGILISSHGGTHVDALNEYAKRKEDKPGITEIPLEWCFGPGICLDVSHVKPLEWITPEDLEKALEKSGLEIPKGGTVLLYTGHYDRTYGTMEYLTTYPGLNAEASHWLADRGVRNVGVDTPSIDKADDYECVAHMVFMERDMLNTENLCNLDKVVNKEFIYCGLPLKLRGCTGSPIRAVAILIEE